MKPMKPDEAGFDGVIGLSHPFLADGGYFNLRRGGEKSKPPWSLSNSDTKNQLFWWTPEEEENRLFYCNREGKWFELSFHPISVDGW